MVQMILVKLNAAMKVMLLHIDTNNLSISYASILLNVMTKLLRRQTVTVFSNSESRRSYFLNRIAGLKRRCDMRSF